MFGRTDELYEPHSITTSPPVTEGHDRRLTILGHLLGSNETFTSARLCRVCADVTGLTGAGVMLMTDDVARGSVCTTEENSAEIE